MSHFHDHAVKTFFFVASIKKKMYDHHWEGVMWKSSLLENDAVRSYFSSFFVKWSHHFCLLWIWWAAKIFVVGLEWIHVWHVKILVSEMICRCWASFHHLWFSYISENLLSYIIIRFSIYNRTIMKIYSLQISQYINIFSIFNNKLRIHS